MPPQRKPRAAVVIPDDEPAKTPAEAAADEDEAETPRPTRPKPTKPTSGAYFDDLDEPPKPLPRSAPPKPPAAKAGGPAAFADTRKLTKAQQASLAAWRKPEQRGAVLDSFFRAQADACRTKFGHSAVFIGDETRNLVVGIPCPALAFEYVICQDCFPLGLIIQIVAKHGVGKSALVAEFGRWFRMAGGGMELLENETKFNPLWYEAILTKEVFDHMPFHRCSSVEDWQRHLTFATKSNKSLMEGTKEKPGPGRIFPIMYGVDSIMGKMSEENQEKIVGGGSVTGGKSDSQKKKKTQVKGGEGFAQSRAYPIEAGSITKYLRTYPQLIDGWPFSLVLVNHLRIKQDDNGLTERSKTGGVQLDFQESFELELKREGGKKISCAEYEGNVLVLKCEKNSFGPTGRSAKTRLLWWYEDTPAGLEQRAVWDWDWATVHLLNFIQEGEGASTYLRSRLKASGFHLECPSAADIENRAWSASLGMKAKDALPWSQVGALIREDAALMNTLRDALCISRRPRMAGDFGEQLTGLAAKLP